LCGSEIKDSDVGVTREFDGTGELTAVWKKYKTRSIVLRTLLHIHLSDQERLNGPVERMGELVKYIQCFNLKTLRAKITLEDTNEVDERT
jgi:hypothetical protein